MGYLNEDGLARYDGLIKNWVTFKSGTVDGIDPLLNWQKTETAGAVTCYPLPAAPIDPVVNFAFTETGPASGTKFPDNPSIITGVAQAKVTRCGKNLLNMAGISGFTLNGVTFVVDSNAGTVTVTSDGPATADTTFYVAIWPNMKMYANQQYFLSGCPAGGSADTYYLGGSYYSEDGVYGGRMSPDFGSGALLVKEFNWRCNCIIRIKSGTTVSNLVFRPQLELGSIATAFEPYEGTDYTVNLNGTYYGGAVDLSAGTMTVTWRANTLNGSEAALSSTAGYLLQQTTSVYIDKTNLEVAGFIGANGYTNNIACTMFDVMSQDTGSEGIRIAQNGNFCLCLDNARLVAYGYGYGDSVSDAVAAVKAWLADNNVTIFYRTTQPLTVSLTPLQIYSLYQLDPYTPRLNTVYSNQTSVQIGYPKSPLATSTELTNAIISLGGNI